MAAIAQREFTPGSHTIAWDGNSSEGERLAPGAYFIQLQTADYKTSRKVIVAE